MRDLEIRGAGNLLGDEQSGHVAAVGFELYCQMLEDAAEAAARRGRRAARPSRASRCGSTSTWTPTSPPDYIPFEAAKIDVHRRVAAAREPGELRALREELEDRFGPGPESGREPARPAARADRARRRGGPRSVEFRAGRLRVSPIELDSEQVAALNERVPDAIYQWRERTIAVPVPDEPGARLGALLALAEGWAPQGRVAAA